jgi:hypothetical protein
MTQRGHLIYEFVGASAHVPTATTFSLLLVQLAKINSTQCQLLRDWNNESLWNSLAPCINRFDMCSTSLQKHNWDRIDVLLRLRSSAQWPSLMGSARSFLFVLLQKCTRRYSKTLLFTHIDLLSLVHSQLPGFPASLVQMRTERQQEKRVNFYSPCLGARVKPHDPLKRFYWTCFLSCTSDLRQFFLLFRKRFNQWKDEETGWWMRERRTWMEFLDNL